MNVPTPAAIRAELARRSLAAFVRQSWHVLEPSTPLVWNWHLDVVCDHVQALFEGRIPRRNLLIHVPPGTSKSRIVAVCAVAWWWTRHPEARFLCASGNPRVAVRDSIYCRDLVTSRWYREAFRPAWKLTGDQNAKTLFRNTRGGFRSAIGSGARVTGDRADILIGDDLLDAADAFSAAERERIRIWVDQAWYNRVNDATAARRVVVGQRLHEADPYGHLWKSGAWDRLVIRQEYEAPRDDDRDPVAPTSLGWTDPRTEPGALLDPIRFPADVLALERVRLGPGYDGQHQQRPVAAEGGMFKRAYWTRYPWKDGEAPADLVKRLGVTRVVFGVDTAMTTKTTGDRSALRIVGETPTRFYLLGGWKDRLEAPDVKARIVETAAAWRPTAIVIEGEGSHSGKVIAQEMRRETRLPIVEVKNVDKVVRANAVLPTVAAGAVAIPDAAPWVADWLDELAGFPLGAHDDDVDATCIALDYLIHGGGDTGFLEFLRRRAEEQAKAKAPPA